MTPFSLHELSPEPFLLFFEPPSIDERIVNQYAASSIVSRADVSPGEYLAARPELVRETVIPREARWEVRDKLDQANVTERTLFPGLDGLCAWLSRRYRPRQRL